MPLGDLAAAGLVRVRRLVRPRADAVADRVRRLAGVARAGEPVADQPVELGEARARAGSASIAPLVHLEQRGLELAVLGAQLARAEQLRVVAPVAVGADPDLEQRRLVRRHGPVAGGGERPDPAARPDEREAERELDAVRASPCPRRGRTPARARPPRSPASPAAARRGRAPSPPRRSRSRAASARSPARS